MVQRVLLTGNWSGLAAHILSQLLSANFSVRAVVEDEDEVEEICLRHPTAPLENLDFALVPDITEFGAFDKALQEDGPFDVVIHTPPRYLIWKPWDNLEDLLELAKQGTEEILRAANAEHVTRVVMTSNFAAVLDYDAGDNGKRYTADDWNPTTWEEAVKGYDDRLAYRASRKFAEKAAWEFMERERPQFELVTLCPPMMIGPPAHQVRGNANQIESNKFIYDWFFSEECVSGEPVKPAPLYLYVDVRDLATAHLRAATVPQAKNKRFIVCKGHLNSQEVSDILRKNFPQDLEDTTPVGTPGTSSLPENAYSADSSPAEEVLGIKFRSTEETIVDLGREFLDAQANRGLG